MKTFVTLGSIVLLGILCWLIKDKEYDDWKNENNK
jgi:hypothetical protein